MDGVWPSRKTVFGNEIIGQTNLKMSKKLNKIYKGFLEINKRYYVASIIPELLKCISAN